MDRSEWFQPCGRFDAVETASGQRSPQRINAPSDCLVCKEPASVRHYGTKFGGISFCRCLLRHVRAALAGPSSMYWSTVFLPSKRRALSPRMAGALMLIVLLTGCSGGVLEPQGSIGAANTKIIYNALAIM